MARPPSYLGITGFMNPDEIRRLFDRIDANLWNGRQLMVGVLASSKTMQGQANKWPGRYPGIDQVPTIFLDDPRALNIIHFNTDQPEVLAADLEKMLELAGPNCHGVQLNLGWPNPRQLNLFRLAFPNARVILQLGKKVLETLEHSPMLIADYVKNYAVCGLITDLLHDMSGGEGIFSGEEIERAGAIIEAISHACPNIGIGFAGGLDAGRLHEVLSLIHKFPWVNIDAEGQLRTPVEDKYHNQLDGQKAYDYAKTGLTLFSS